jgi:hypothetical protein
VLEEEEEVEIHLPLLFVCFHPAVQGTSDLNGLHKMVCLPCTQVCYYARSFVIVRVLCCLSAPHLHLQFLFSLSRINTQVTTTTPCYIQKTTSSTVQKAWENAQNPIKTSTSEMAVVNNSDLRSLKNAKNPSTPAVHRFTGVKKHGGR